jgi:cytochrome P450
MANRILTTVLPTSFIGLVGSLLGALAAYHAYYILSNYFFHKLRRFPGPLGCAVSKLPVLYHMWAGDLPQWQTDLHRKYGDVVRYSPNELSFSGAEALRDIHGHRIGSHTLEKDPRFYKNPVPGQATAMTSANYADHSRMRRVFSNAFSDRALKLQEPLFLTYVDQLVEKLREGVAKQPTRKWNMVRMYNFTTFDVMGDLTFGDPLGMLENDEYNVWVDTIFKSIKFGSLIHIMRYFPAFEDFLFSFVLPRFAVARKGMQDHKNFTSERVDKRLTKQDPRPDIWGLVLKRDGSDSGLTRKEMYENAGVLMVAGTETTATLLSGLTYYLLKNPEHMKRLTDEIRSTFKHESEITIEKLQAMKYVHACIEEGLRVYPPVPNGLPRLTPEGETTMIDGKAIPGGVGVMAPHLAVYRNPDNFVDAEKFAPERWMPDEKRYAADQKQSFQPFSLGPRGCLGKK